MRHRTAQCVCVRVVLCHRATKPTQRGRNEEQGNAVNEINVFSSKEPSLWRRAPSLFSSRLIKKAIPPSLELPHSWSHSLWWKSHLINDHDDNGGEGVDWEQCVSFMHVYHIWFQLV